MQNLFTSMEKSGYQAKYNGVADITIQTKRNNNYKTTSFTFCFKEQIQKRREIKLQFSFPAVDIVGMWTPVCGLNRNIKADWSPASETMMSISSPVTCFYNNQSENVHTIALSEVKQKVSSTIGIREENGQIVCKISMEIPKGLFEESYEIVIWESDEKEFFWNTIHHACVFWENQNEYSSMPVPDAAREPMYSFWYSYHQDVTAKNVEKESRRAADMGFSTIIVDDGWQTEDNNRGYAFCGDWEPSRIKFPNFSEHIKKVQNMGLKYMIWFSVPFIGEKAKCFRQLSDKLLFFDEASRAGTVDIRYPDVRDYLKGIFAHAVRDWGVDGLKLDFIDEFYIREDSPEFNEKMDCADVQEALGLLLADTITELRKIKPDVLIEFRQRYIGPEIRKYGNMMRVVDCPGSALNNRVGVADLRLTSGDTAVHSDMLMWHPDETVENAALQVLACLFSTVQISVRLTELNGEKKEMLEFWLDFMKRHRELLQQSNFEPYQPHNLYPRIRVFSKEEKKELLISYVENHYLSLDKREEQFFYINAGGASELVLEGHPLENRQFMILDCKGCQVMQGSINAGAIQKVHIPEAGMALFSTPKTIQ